MDDQTKHIEYLEDVIIQLTKQITQLQDALGHARPLSGNTLSAETLFAARDLAVRQDPDYADALAYATGNFPETNVVYGTSVAYDEHVATHLNHVSAHNNLFAEAAAQLDGYATTYHPTVSAEQETSIPTGYNVDRRRGYVSDAIATTRALIDSRAVGITTQPDGSFTIPSGSSVDRGRMYVYPTPTARRRTE